MTNFGPDPEAPRASELNKAHTVLLHTRSTAASFLRIFVGRGGGRGARSDQDYDLLRAMLVFACAGLDSTIKHVIRDSLAVVIERVAPAEDNFRDFVQRRLGNRADLDATLLARVLTDASPRSVLIGELVRDLTAQSLQSRAQVLRAGSFFDLPSSEIIGDMALFDRIFRARNQIAHEMDIDFDQPRRTRAPRPKQEMVNFTWAILDCAAGFLTGVDRQLGS